MRKTAITRVLFGAAVLFAAFVNTETTLAADMQPLASAVRKGDAAAVRLLLKQGADPNTDWSGSTVLTWASQYGDLAVVKVLVEHHANIDTKGSNGDTPLTVAVSYGHADVVSYLIAHGAKVNLENGRGWTPLDLAEGGRRTGIARLLRAHGAVNGLPPLLAAANRGDAAQVRQLLASGADPNMHNAENDTAVFLAVGIESLESVKVLVEHGADVNAATVGGLTPLMLAAADGNKDVIAYLVAHGADLNLLSAANLRAVDMAELYKHPDVAALLRTYGAKSGSEFTDADCAGFRHWADMGVTTGYSSLIAGPGDQFDQMLHLKPATVSFGGSRCDVGSAGEFLACTFDEKNGNYRGGQDYQSYVTFAKACSGDSKVESTADGTNIWYNRVHGRTLLILIYATEHSLTIRFGADQPL